MAYRIRIFPAAKRAIKEIWHYTQRTWSTEQADRYVRGLDEAIKKAAQDRSVWKTADYEGLVGVFYVKYERHITFFRVLSQEEIGVISVLHDNMDIPIRLKNDGDEA